MSILLARIRFGPIDLAIGASGPGVDMALYFYQRITHFPIIQFIHGPVACSRSIARCLLRADNVYYLRSARESLVRALSRLGTPNLASILQSARFSVLDNALPESAWPRQCQYHSPRVFWAASLLTWKGLERLLCALKHDHLHQQVSTDICYIRPRAIDLPVTPAPQKIARVNWHQNPKNLDDLRAQNNIFISTSTQEPFGLSILEALAAGQCVLIPRDGAYWDGILVDQVDCLKYEPNSCIALHDAIQRLIIHPDIIQRIGQSGQLVAQQYQADTRYAELRKCLIKHLLRSAHPISTQVSECE